jgi:hypothetical protein
MGWRAVSRSVRSPAVGAGAYDGDARDRPPWAGSGPVPGAVSVRCLMAWGLGSSTALPRVHGACVRASIGATFGAGQAGHQRAVAR